MTLRPIGFAFPSSRTVVAGRLLIGRLLFGVVLIAGCREREDITTVIEPHAADVIPAGPAKAATKSASVPGRLVGALLDHGDSTWFFKALGPDDAVRRQVSQIKGLLVGLKFENDQPVWKLPEGWKEERNNPGRYATLLMDDAQPPLELAVSRFPGGQNLADNVNRWRGQVGLPSQSPDEVAKSIEEIKTAGGTARYVELAGNYSPESSAMPPFAGGAAQGKDGKTKPPADDPHALPAGHPPVAAMPGPAQPGVRQPGPVKPKGDAHQPTTGPVRFVAPAEWLALPPSQFNVAAFAVTEGNEKLRITVSQAQGDMLSNINRWREQELTLPPIDATQLETAVTKLKIGGRDADFVELIGPANTGPQQAIFAVVIPDGAGSSWFLKLKGDAPLAQHKREQFSQFLATFRIVSQ